MVEAAAIATNSISGRTVPDAIRVENVSKVYQGRRWLGLRNSSSESKYALRDVSFTVREGEMVGLLGPNGAGKTTMLKSIATLLQPTSGRIVVCGRNVESDHGAARRLMGLVTCDERSFYWRLSGRQNLKFFAALYGLPDKLAADRIAFLLDKLGLAHAGDLPYQNYSSGMRQKMAVARGLLADPKVILYDEPTRSLDPLSAQNIRDWIAANHQADPATTHILATNQLGEAEQLCDRVLILNRGVIIAEGSVSEIRDRFGSRGALVHSIRCSGFALNGSLQPEPEIGLFDLHQEWNDGGGVTIRATTNETGEALTVVLGEILKRGGTILRCETEQMRFDEVFCSLVLADTSARQSQA
jgi:ABC-2 type transport system ATP-binding protein